MQPAVIAWTICLLPLSCIHISWLWSASADTIPWCNPYWDGCVSISRAARSSDALFFFRACMILTAAWLVIYWRLCGYFLQVRKLTQKPYAMLCLGYMGAGFLVLYADFLGTDGTVYRLMRRYGVTFFFTFTVLAQYLYTRHLWHHQAKIPIVSGYLKLKIGLGLFVLAIGFISLGATVALENPAKDRWENVTEWWFALAMMGYFGVCAKLWQQVAYRIS
jgi:hypothetical protein